MSEQEIGDSPVYAYILQPRPTSTLDTIKQYLKALTEAARKAHEGGVSHEYIPGGLSRKDDLNGKLLRVLIIVPPKSDNTWYDDLVATNEDLKQNVTCFEVIKIERVDDGAPDTELPTADEAKEEGV